MREDDVGDIAAFMPMPMPIPMPGVDEDGYLELCWDEVLRPRVFAWA